MKAIIIFLSAVALIGSFLLGYVVRWWQDYKSTNIKK
jgi:preprotein translocase subunit Sec63